MIYVLYNPFTELYKIGMTKDLRARKRELEFAAGVGLNILHVMYCEDDRALEGKLHTEFKHVRRLGEWFALTTEDLAYIASMYGDVIRHTKLMDLEAIEYFEVDGRWCGRVRTHDRTVYYSASTQEEIKQYFTELLKLNAIKDRSKKDLVRKDAA